MLDDTLTQEAISRSWVGFLQELAMARAYPAVYQVAGSAVGKNEVLEALLPSQFYIRLLSRADEALAVIFETRGLTCAHVNAKGTLEHAKETLANRTWCLQANGALSDSNAAGLDRLRQRRNGLAHDAEPQQASWSELDAAADHLELCLVELGLVGQRLRYSAEAFQDKVQSSDDPAVAFQQDYGVLLTRDGEPGGWKPRSVLMRANAYARFVGPSDGCRMVGSSEPPNKGMEQTNGAVAGVVAPFAAHPRCCADKRDGRSRAMWKNAVRVAVCTACTLWGLPAQSQERPNAGATPEVGYDEFMKLDVQRRLRRFNEISAENKAAIVRQHAERWLEKNRARLNDAQVAVVQENIAFITPTLYRIPRDPEVVKRAKELEAKAVAVLSRDDGRQALTIHGDYIPR